MANETKRKPSKKQSQKVARKSRFWGVFFRSVLLLGLLIVFGGILFAYLKYGKSILSMQKMAKDYVWSSNEDTFRQTETSIFFDASGEVISTLSGEKKLYYVQYEDIPAVVIDAIVTIEDKRFFEHRGVDFIANIRAAIALVKNEGKITQGASTITQQLARNIFLTNEVTYERKVKEIFIASELEKKYSKQKILEFYLNNIYFANGYYGIQAASKGYFNKSVSELTLSEAAFLCAIPNGPMIYDPVHHIDQTYQRRDKILNQMYEDGVIDKKQYKKARNEKTKIVKQVATMYNYAETYIYQCTIESLMKKDGFLFQDTFSSPDEKAVYQEAYQERYQHYQSMLYTGGYRVYTSIDLNKQELLQKVLDEKLSSYTSVNEQGVYELQGSAVCVDNENGRVIAIVGGRSQEFNSYTLNRAYQSYRQPGSSVKPLIVYLPYFMEGHNPDEIMKDEAIEDGPKNADHMYSGDISLRYAVETSKNTIAWKIFEELTPKVGLSYLKRLNFQKIVEDDEVLAASLGGLTYGTNTLEMAAGYATIENDGVYRKPTCIVRITDASGNSLIEEETSEKVVYDKESCRIMTDVMCGVMTEGTGKNLSISNAITAGKTGTTTDRKDGWFVGYSSYYTTSVWVGYDYPKAMAELGGNTLPGYIWHDFMQQIHEGKDMLSFPPYIDTWTTEEELEEEEEIEDSFEEEEDVNQDLEENLEPTEIPENEDSNTSDRVPEEESTEPTEPTPTPDVTIPSNPDNDLEEDKENDLEDDVEDEEVEDTDNEEEEVEDTELDQEEEESEEEYADDEESNEVEAEP